MATTCRTVESRYKQTVQLSFVVRLPRIAGACAHKGSSMKMETHYRVNGDSVMRKTVMWEA